jgi:DNA-binding MarR family transcriptional regulator
MTPIAARLEARGLVQRIPADGRSLGLDLTAEGARMANLVKAKVDAFEQEVIAAVPAADRAHLLPALKAIWARFGA